jgi:hypothetical protein
MTTRRKRPSSDAYLDDDPLDENNCLKDGRTYRSSMMLADSTDSGPYLVDSRATPPHPARFAYKRGYVSDARTNLIVDARSPTKVGQGTIPVPAVPTRAYEPLPRGEAFPTQSDGTWPSYNHNIGDPCECEDGTKGRLAPHPSTSSMLICEPLARDAASVYYAMKDAAQHEWRKHGPRPLHDCGCHTRTITDQPGTVGYINPQLAWPQGQTTGNTCTINGRAGHYQRGTNGELICVPDPANGKSDADIVAPMGTFPVGGNWPEGCACDLGNGEYGVLVKEGDRLVCRERQVGNGDASVDHQAIRDRAYAQSVRAAEQAWKQW